MTMVEKIENIKTTNFSAVIHATLPPHAVPGQTFEVLAGGQIVRVTCPQQFQAGQTVRIKVPAYPIAPQNEEDSEGVRRLVFQKRLAFMATVPEGVKGGETFQVKLEGRPPFLVRAPASYGPGMSFRFIPPPLTSEQIKEELGNEATTE